MNIGAIGDIGEIQVSGCGDGQCRLGNRDRFWLWLCKIMAETVTQLQIHVELQSLGPQKLFYAFHKVINNYI